MAETQDHFADGARRAQRAYEAEQAVEARPAPAPSDAGLGRMTRSAAATADVAVFCYPEEPWRPEPAWDGWEAGPSQSQRMDADRGGDRATNRITDRATDWAIDRATDQTTDWDIGPSGGEAPRWAHASPENCGVDEAVARAFEEGRAVGHSEGQEAGLTEGRNEERELDAAIRAREQEERSRSAAELVNGFLREQERYLHRIEHEVVELALAVASRILRREVQADPLLLTGAVRVALGQLSESTRVVLNVPPEDLSLWMDAMRLVPNLALRPVVLAGEGMKLGECRITTEMGSVDLGLKAQLDEIERGFFDRLGSRPESISAESSRSGPSQEETLHGEPPRTQFPCAEAPQESSSLPLASGQPMGRSETSDDGEYLDEPLADLLPERERGGQGKATVGHAAMSEERP